MKSGNGRREKAVKKRKKRSISFATIAEMLFSLVLIPVGLLATGILENAITMEQLALLMMGAIVLLSLTTFLRGKARRYRNQISRRRIVDFIFSAVSLACAAAVYIRPTLPVMSVAGAVFMVSLIPSRVLSILRSRKWYNILMNAAFILLILLSLWEVWSGGIAQLEFVVVVMLLLALSGLLRIISVTFARLRLDLMKDIVRKTYAAEIIFGMVLLIVSFSFVLLYTDWESFHGEYTNALWYCFAVVTTIGFGDMTAVSTIGRILSVILGIYGIVVVALITSIIVNFYGEMKKAPPEEEAPAPEEDREQEFDNLEHSLDRGRDSQ